MAEAKHRRNRLINERFTQLAHEVLVPGGIVYLRTDDQDYFKQMQSVVRASPLFQSVETPEELSAVVTDFEKKIQRARNWHLGAAYQRS